MGWNYLNCYVCDNPLSHCFSGEMTVSCPEMRDGCSYRYFVGVDMATDDFTAVHVTYNRSMLEE